MWCGDTTELSRKLPKATKRAHDPGQSGGLAILDRAGLVVDVSPMPERGKDLSDCDGDGLSFWLSTYLIR
jgi:hypothetical protein